DFIAGVPFTLDQEVHHVFARGVGMVGSKDPNAWSYYSVSLGRDGAVSIWRKSKSKARVKIASVSIAAPVSGTWHTVELRMTQKLTNYRKLFSYGKACDTTVEARIWK